MVYLDASSPTVLYHKQAGRDVPKHTRKGCSVIVEYESTREPQRRGAPDARNRTGLCSSTTCPDRPGDHRPARLYQRPAGTHRHAHIQTNDVRVPICTTYLTMSIIRTTFLL